MRCGGESQRWRWQKTKEGQKDKREEGGRSTQEKCQKQIERRELFPRKMNKCENKGRTQRAGERKIVE